MVYKVKVIFNDKIMPSFEGRFNSTYINEDSEMLMLFREDSNKGELPHRTVRYAIPLADIDSVEIVPIYEDNGQKIPRC